jgi:hypothetical protein
MRASEFTKPTVTESNHMDADQVLNYVKKTHAPEEFNIEYSITDHPAWELKNIPVSQLNLDPDGEQQDPYNRTNWVDYDVVRDLIPRIVQVLESKPIVVDADGWIIDGNHRAMAAAEAGLTSVPALVPAVVKEGVAEARKNPEQNTKYQSGWAELAAWAHKNNVWLKPHEWAISMTYVPKLGINPGPGISEDTPRGIYFYPFHWAYSVKMDKEALPWADNAPYIQLFQYSTGTELYDPNQIPLASAVAQLKNYGITDEDIAAEKENYPSISTYNLLVWCLGRKYDDNKRVSILNKVLRNLGYDYMIDNGKGWIAINEPTQGVVLNPKIIDKVVTFNNYTRKKEQDIEENFADGKNPGRKEIDPDVYEDLSNSIIARTARQIVPTIRAKSTPEGYVYLSTQDGLSLVIGCNIAGGSIDINIGSQPMETTSSGPHKGAVTKIIEAVYQAAAKKYGAPIKQGTLSIDHDAGHGVWQHIAQKLGLQHDAYMVKENFADGRNPGRKGLAKRSGVNTKASVSSLRKTAKNSSGEKQRMAHWLANMKAGRAKAKRK